MFVFNTGLLSNSELSHGNAAQVVGYKFGAIVGGGLLSWLSSFFSLSVLFMSLSGFYALGLAFASTYSGFDENMRIHMTGDNKGETFKWRESLVNLDE